jgi:flagellar hook-associated protein 2
LTQLVGARYSGVGQFNSLASIGITLDKNGQMQLDQDKLTAAFNKDPDSVKNLFTDDKNGIATKLNDTIEHLAGDQNSILSARADALTKTIDTNNDRISDMNDRLEKQREALLEQFDNLETTVAGLKNNLNALESLQIIPPIGSSSSSSSS